MTTSTGELVDQAQRVAWDLVQALPDSSWHRRAEARALVEGHLRGWPALAQAGIRALRSTVVPGEDYQRYQPARAALERVAAQVPTEGPGDPRLERLGVIVGAVADLVDGTALGESWTEQDLAAFRDKIGAVLESAARTTAGYLDVAFTTTPAWGRGVRDLTAVAETLHVAAVTHPGRRAGALDDVGVPEHGHRLEEAMRVWAVSVEDHLAFHVSAAAPRTLRAIAREAALVSRATAASMTAGGHADVLDRAAAQKAAGAAAAAAAQWAKTAETWIDVGGGRNNTPEHFTAGRQLRRAIAETFRAEDGWIRGDQLAAGATPGEVARLGGQARWMAMELERATRSYASAAQELVTNGALLVPGQQIFEELRGRGGDLVDVRRSGFAPVPPGRSVAATRDLIRTAQEAVDLCGRARTASEETARVSTAAWPPGTTRAAGVGSLSPGYRAARTAASSFPQRAGQAPASPATLGPPARPRSAPPQSQPERER